MELRLSDKHQLIDTTFGTWLLPHVKREILRECTNTRLPMWDKYLTESQDIPKLYPKKTYHAMDVLLFAANNLVCEGVDGEIYIRLNSAKFVPGYDRVKLDTLAKMINYGTRDCFATSVFTKAFQKIADDIDKYLSLYYNIL